MKTLAPWSLAVVLAAVCAFLFFRGGGAESELAVLRQQAGELQSARAENERLKSVEVQSDELARLRRENQELHRLRNEVRVLREQSQTNAGAVAGRPGRSASPAGPAPAAAAGDTQQLQVQLQQLRVELENLRAQNLALQQRHLVDGAASACINNLRILEGAKDQWALENKKGLGALASAADLQSYIKDNVLPACPAGGVYAINALGAPATCSVHGHALSQ
jgi:hypothetical protein